jgi:hypothetical protein
MREELMVLHRGSLAAFILLILSLTMGLFVEAKIKNGGDFKEKGWRIAQALESPSQEGSSHFREETSKLLALFSELDANHDGSITFEEWNGSRASFNQMDSNGDGLIARGEFLGIGGEGSR